MQKRLIRRVLRHPAFLCGLVLFCFVLGAALAAPGLTSHDPARVQLTKRLLPPAGQGGGRPEFKLGTDQVGRDLLTRLVYGSRWSLIIALSATLSAAMIGIVLGLTSGYIGGWADKWIIGLADIQVSIPPMLLALAIAAALGPSLRNLILVLALTGWVVYARTVRAQVLVIRNREYIQAAEALGAGRVRILLRHLLPNVLTPIIIIFSQQLGFMILMEAAMSFLGLGVQPPTPSWGSMIAEARDYLPTAPWVVLLPGGALMVTVLAVNLLGDGLRDILDPRLRI